MRKLLSHRRGVGATMVGALSLGMMVAAPAITQAEVAMAEAISIEMDSDDAGITAQGQTQARPGEDYRITGTNWCYGDKTTGQWIAVKLIDGPDTSSGNIVNMDDAHKAVATPDGGTEDLGHRGVFAMIKADDDTTGNGECALDATVTLPEESNSLLDPAKFTPGSETTVALLAGSFGPKTGGGAPHSALLRMTVADNPPAPTPDSERTVTMSADRTQGLIGQYQGAYSADTGKFYVTGVPNISAAEGVVTNAASTIGEYNPETKKIERAAVLPAIPATEGRSIDDPAGLSTQVMPHGIAVDDARDLIWTTDTRQDLASAYDRDTFEEVWRADEGVVIHGRDVMVRDNGDVIFGGKNGVWKVTGERDSFQVTQLFDYGYDGFTAPMGMADLGDSILINSLRENVLRKIDGTTGEVVGTIDLQGVSATEGISHGGLGVDSDLGVVVSADQGVRDSETRTYTNAGVSFYKLDGTSLGHLPVGTQNLNVHIDQANHIAYVGDFGTGDINAFDLNSAANGTPAHIGQISLMTGGRKGVNHIVSGGGHTLVVGKDAGFSGVTVPWGMDPKTGDVTDFTGDADSLALLETSIGESVFDPATDVTASTKNDGYDTSVIELSPVSGDDSNGGDDDDDSNGGDDDDTTGGTGSLGGLFNDSEGGLFGSSEGGLQSPLVLGLLGLSGFVGGVLAGMFTPINDFFAPLLSMIAPR